MEAENKIGKEIYFSGRCYTSASDPGKPVRIAERNLNWMRSHIHRHDSPEVFLVVSGQCSFMLEGKLFHLRRGDLMLIDSMESHSGSHLPDKRLTGCWNIIWPDTMVFLLWQNNRISDSQKLKTGNLNQLILKIWSDLKGPSEVRAKQELLGLFSAMSSYFLRRGELLWNHKSRPKQVMEEIDDYVDQLEKLDCTLDSLARTAGYSRVHFQRLFREYTGLTFREYMLKKRLERYRLLLGEVSPNVKEIADQLGFSSVKTFKIWVQTLLARGIRIFG